MLQTFKNQILL